jgi:hypothetical protein
MGLIRARGAGAWALALGGGAAGPSNPGNSLSVSLMGTPFGPTAAAAAPYLKGMPVFDYPLQRFALFQFQSFSQRSGADHIVLAVFAASPDDLQFRVVCHTT